MPCALPSRRLAALAAAAFLATACSKVTADNYAKLKVGMSYQETAAILGSPARCDETAGFRTCKWGDDKSSITVRFAADKAVLHSAENVR
jgi:outer membrane protein assembly factor BamE (lipoprotein component of BamABCDE complex)